ncbi:MAG: UDP-2,4-diacetamido-2,4,6-trideoxy-beta-L-altropyranose hydrolase [Candidatus Rokubacteria bacterium]|nr:UDP-2,4-diacetamido-2,4,6-trideoxy-beta-L-altropyranose hydrolase [Candidatus Rokubacteria bacterium]
MALPGLLIRVDGNETIGMGHVMRCLYLADELRTRGSAAIEFVTKQSAASVGQIEGAGYRAHVLPADIEWADEIVAVATWIGSSRVTAVITDLRWPEAGYLSRLKSTGALVVVIDEWGDKKIVADVLTNGTAVSAWHRYTTEEPVVSYLGVRYALLHPSFADAHRRERQIPAVGRNVLIALGGDDPYRLTVKVMKSLESVVGSLSITSIIGPAFIDEADIRAVAAVSRHRYTVLKNVSNMAELMCAADVALVGGGLTALETACTGTPALIVCEVDHQVDTAEALEAAGAAQSLGLGTETLPATIADRVAALLSDQSARSGLSRAGKTLVDGGGTQRIADVIDAALRSRLS